MKPAKFAFISVARLATRSIAPHKNASRTLSAGPACRSGKCTPRMYHKGKGCWYFEFDDHGLVGTKVVLVKRLNDLPLEWGNEGRTFAVAMRAQRER